MKAKQLVACCVACVAMVACGGDGDGEGIEKAVQEALRGSMTEDDIPFEVTDDMLGCIAGKVLENDTFGPALEAAYDDGKTGEALLDAVDTDANEDELTATTLKCFSAEQLIDAMGSELTPDGSELTDDQRTCLVAELDKIDADERASGLLALAQGTTGSSAAGAITGALVTCLGTDFG